LDTQDAEPELLEVRKDLRDCFGAIDCFLMPYPGQEVAEGDSGSIDDRFKAHLEAFIPSILKSSELEVKAVLGNEVTCGGLKDYIRQYTMLFKDGSMPEVTGIFDATAKLNHDGIRRSCSAMYKTEMREYAGPDKPHRVAAELQTKHDSVYNTAVKTYTESPRLEAPRVEQAMLADLQKEINEMYADIASANEQKVLFKKLVTPIALGGLSLLCNIIATFLAMFGLASIATLFS
jgi:atlastin